VLLVGQLAWTFVLGLWYGYCTIECDRLLPAMIVHWFGNAFAYRFTWFVQLMASPSIHALYFLVFGLGIVPAGLLMLWTRFFSARWLPPAPARLRSEGVSL